MAHIWGAAGWAIKIDLKIKLDADISDKLRAAGGSPADEVAAEVKPSGDKLEHDVVVAGLRLQLTAAAQLSRMINASMLALAC